MNKKAVGALVTYVGIMVGGMLILKVLVRATDGPDYGRTMKMRMWLSVKGVADNQSRWWGDVGLKAGTQYNKCRL